VVTSFPFGNGLIEQSFSVFRGSSQTLISFAPLIFLARLVILQATMGGQRDYSALLKELLYLYAGLFVFQEVMEMVMRAPEVADHMLKNPDPIMIKRKDRGWLEIITDLFAIDLVNIISSSIYWLVCFCYLIMMSFLITIGAYIILFSTMFRMKWMIKAYLSLVLILSIWPFVWYSVDQAFLFVVKGLESTKHNNGVIIAKAMGGLMKVSVPVVGAAVALKAPVAAVAGAVSQAMKAGASVKNAAGKGVKGAKKIGKAFGIQHAAETVRRDPNRKLDQIESKRRDQRFGLKDTGPALAYGLHRARFALKNDHSVKRMSTDNGHRADYPELEKKAPNYRSYRRKLENRYHERKEIQAEVSEISQKNIKRSVEESTNTKRVEKKSRHQYQVSSEELNQSEVRMEHRFKRDVSSKEEVKEYVKSDREIATVKKSYRSRGVRAAEPRYSNSPYPLSEPSSRRNNEEKLS